MAFTNFNNYLNNPAPNGISAPLATLEGNGYSYSNFIYPLDLGGQSAGKDHYMVFNINESQNSMYSTYASSTFSTNLAAANADSSAASSAAFQSQINQNVIKDASSVALAQTGTTTGANTTSLVQNLTRNTNRVSTTIVLYLPNDIQTSNTVDWSEKELGVMEGIMGLGLQTTSKSLVDMVSEVGASFVKTVLGPVASTFTGLNLTDAFSLTNRLVINNHLEVLFNGIKFREFRFNFRFTPQSEDEAVVADNIIRAFKFYSAPELVQGYSGRFWTYPAEFDMQYYANGVPNQFLNKISTCACTNVSVNYTPTGHWSAFRPHSNGKGSPSVCTDLSLTFMELELMTKQRVIEGY